MHKSIFILCLLLGNLLGAQTEEEYFKKALSEFNAKKYEKAIGTSRKAILANPLRDSAYIVKALSEWECKMYDTAITTLSKAIFAIPESHGLYMHRGDLLLEAHQNDRAQSDFHTALKLSVNDSMKLIALQDLSTAKLRVRDFGGCYETLMKGYAIDSNHVGILTNLGVVCDEVGKGDETLKYLERLIAIDSSNVHGYINIGFKYQNMERHTKAITYFDKAISLDPKHGFSYSNRSYSKLMSGDTKGALADINKSIELLPSNSYAYRNRALVYLKMGKTEKACDDIQKALDWGFTTRYGPEVKQLKRDNCPTR